ncbi:electron transfer flavoprotein subunit alpha/FixB family protein [Synechococcus moorigangaii CMS01]|nr:electron transfer flavoprotein subunit alpha/FixB family protein [Synechococcus moorigangaii CMS01]
MSVIVYAESWEGKFKKTTFETVNYAAAVAEGMGTDVVAVTIGELQSNAADLGKYGASKVITVSGDSLSEFNPFTYTHALVEAARTNDGKVIVVNGTFTGKSLAPVIGVEYEAAVITNVVSKPSGFSPLTVQRNAFSSKGLVEYKSNSERAVISIVTNALGVHKEDGSPANVETATFSVDAGLKNTESVNVDRVKGQIPLPEAELVVSAGRGMKGPENWGMIEDLADTLGAATACSKPVSDMGWRPHSEHVGQTGIAINPNLYIAVGISGAVQHLAGVSNSNTIVVINSDPEAPFFKAADYGIVGDAFEVVPKLTEAIKAFKANN